MDTTTIEVEHFLTTDEAAVLAARQRNSLDVVQAKRDHDAALKDLGFDTMQLDYTLDTQRRLQDAGTLFPEMTGKRLRVWQAFLPTQQEAKKYQYDRPPLEVLEAIKDAKSLIEFDRIEYWSPEGNTMFGRVKTGINSVLDRIEELMAATDPMAVGIIKDTAGNEHYFPIVRWGESLMPFEQIERYVRKVDRQMKLLRASRMLVFGLLVSLYIFAMMTFGVETVIYWTLGLAFGGAVAAVILGLLIAVMMDES